MPSNPQLQTRLTIKANATATRQNQKQEENLGSYANYMDDLIFYQGSLRDMIANRRAVFVPKEIENACLFDPDFYLN